MKKMKKMSKRGLALLMSLLMCISMLNLTAFADEGQDADDNTLPAVTEASSTPEATAVSEPTSAPTEAPSTDPTVEPSEVTEPTEAPAADPTAAPTEEAEPTTTPEADPTDPADPEDKPSEGDPTEKPAETEPTEEPAKKPAKAPAKAPAAPVAEGDDEAICTCKWRCSPAVTERTWQGDITYVTRTEDCPVCGGENGDWEHKCKGVQVVADCEPGHAHSWALGWGIQGHIEANCTTPEAWVLLAPSCGAEWLFAFNEASGLNPNNHYFSNYDPVVVPPTCTEPGTSTQTCLLCGEKIVETIPATGHTFDEGSVDIVDPTCVQAGSKTGTCTVCGETVTEVIPSGGGHKPIEDTVKEEPATCTQDGYKTYTCSVCKETVNEPIPAEGHSFNGVNCTKCSAQTHKVMTNDEWGTGIHNSWSECCGYIVKESDGSYYGYSDTDLTKPLEGSITVKVNHGTMNNMGIDRVVTDNDGNTFISTVKGWRNSNDPNGKLYQENDVIPFEEVFEMGTSKEYIIFLDAVREKISAAVTPSGNEAGRVTPIEKIPAKVECTNGITVECTNQDTMQYIPAAGGNKGKWIADITITVDKSFVPGDGHVDFSKAITDIGDIISKSPQLTVQPGDEIVLNIYLDNQSGYELTYKSNSGFLATEVRSTDGETAGIGFDGNALAADGENGFSFTPRRLYNDALKAIVKSTADDAEIGAALRVLGYGKGLKDDAEITRNCLDDYYLDWTNAARRRNDPNAKIATSLQDLTISEFAKLTNGSEGMIVVETCQNLYEALYYFYYGRALEYNGVDIYEQMRQYSEGGNIEMDTNIPLLLQSPTKPYVLNITSLAGEEMNNGFQDTVFGIRMGFDLIATPANTPTPPPVIIISTPTPTPTATATPTPTPEPTEEPSPTPEPSDEPIPDPDVPLGTPKPDATPTPEPTDEPIPDPDVPLGTPKPEEPTPTPVPTTNPTPVPDEDIPDPDVPLANTPKTGDETNVWFLLTVLSAAGLVFIGASEWKKRKGDHKA